ncbi:LacI family DNA-binding transcriptional regulator [uncultured Cohaesibacter sp.]|uniref:LacI family DNA-binding transcriptional regulator n=1 Tax=uncultured Cohaesibacter sp. TaxID=1002546 RepID=UPI0029C702AF|nr:LacI family DNA-binding transcriptional regulator [uncultured Cohaesibacter sp.]
MPGKKDIRPTNRKSGRVSLAEVAAHASVSIATASRIINGITNKASTETIERVKASVEELHYRPASIGRALRCQESRIVGLLAAAIENPMMAAIAASIEQALRNEGYVMSLCDTYERAEVQDEYLLEMHAQLARAVIIIGAVKSPVLDRMRTDGPPLLFVNRPDPGHARSPYVGIDNYQVGRDVADLLIERGIRRVGLIHASLDATAATLRRQGVLDGLATGGVGEHQVVHAHVEGLSHLKVGYDAMQQLLALPNPPRVILCMSDLLAYGAYRRVVEAGFDPVSDFGFIGFDENPLNPWIAGWLNSIGVSADRYGRASVDALKAIWNGDERYGPVYLSHSLRLNGKPLPGELSSGV